jgi:hypothetical protein
MAVARSTNETGEPAETVAEEETPPEQALTYEEAQATPEPENTEESDTETNAG